MQRGRGLRQPGIRATTALLALGLAVGLAFGAEAAAIREEPSGKPAQKARFRAPSAEEARQFYAALAEKGWAGATLARVPANYTQTRDSVRVSDFQEAALYGNVDDDESPEWVLGLYFPPRTPGSPDPEDAMSMLMGRMEAMTGVQDSRARIVVLKQDTGGQWKVSWRSPGLGYEFGAPRFNMREVDQGLDGFKNLRPALSLVDVDGDHRFEIAYHCVSQSASVGLLPGIYRWDRSRWLSVAPQSDRFSLQDVNRDGKLELLTGSRYIGYGMGDDDVPRVWRWKDGQYQEASAEFPRFYGDLARRYAEYLRRMGERGEKVDSAAWERAIQKATSLSG